MDRGEGEKGERREETGEGGRERERGEIDRAEGGRGREREVDGEERRERE